jgi:hypothetical protein
MRQNPFANYPNVNEENFLKVRIERVKNEELPAAFNNAIDVLLQAKRVFEVVNKIGRLPEVGSRSYYLQTVQWLNGEIPLSLFIPVPQINNDRSNIDDSIAMQFEQHVNNLVANIRNDPIYSQVEMMTAVAKVNSTQKIQNREEELLGDFESKAQQVSGLFDSNLKSSQESVTTAVESRGAQLRDQLDSTLTDSRRQLDQQLQTAISQFQQAQSLDDWGTVYEMATAEYEEKLYGRRWAGGTLGRNITALGEKIKRSRNRKDRLLYRIRKFVGLCVQNTMSLISISWSKTVSYRTQRNIWFSLLVTFVVAFTLSSFASATGHTSVFGIPLPPIGNGTDTNWYLKFALYLPPVILLGIAYSFAVKNYRIYSNMVDQYRHRRTVAKTSQGIILSTDNAEVRGQMTAAAALAMFEHRNTGHLTKKEAESMNALDIFKLFNR